MLNNKNILLGITAGIAAYKVYELIRLFKKNNANVKVIITPNALNFVSVQTLQTLTGNRVYSEQYETQNYQPEHISLANWADVFVIAPISANTIGKIANGICDNLLTSIACAYRGKILAVPAMNTGMWENCFVQANLQRLKEAGHEIMEPDVGFLACGEEGKGRMREPREICTRIAEMLCSEKQFLSGKRILITSGGTRENIDKARYITNYSSGKMGAALANAAAEFGAKVTLITTAHQEISKLVNVIDVNTADEMKTAAENNFANCDCLIMAAAVADFKVKNISEQKIKKENMPETVTLELVKNPDILAGLAAKKRENQIVAGFCAETENLLESAKGKLKKKNCDYIIANDISRSDIAFDKDENEVYIIDKKLNTTKLDKASKQTIAKRILEFIFNEQR